MDFIGQLWQPILLATVLCFVMSALVWMAGPHHKAEWKAPPNQDGVMDQLRQGNAGAGAYLFPYADRSNKAAFDEAMKKFAEGPAGVLYIFPRGPMKMGPMLAKQFAFFLFVSFMLAYVGHHSGLDGQPYLRVFQVIGASAFMIYGIGSAPESIWFGRPWKSWMLGAVDGLLYALVTAGAFGWRWPR